MSSLPPAAATAPQIPSRWHRRLAAVRAGVSLGLLALAASVLPPAAHAQSFVAEWSTPDIGRVGPTGMVLDTVGGVTYLYVADENNGRILKFEPSSGQRLAAWGTVGNGDNQFNSPYGLAIDPVSHDLYVAERGNHRVKRIRTTDGSFVLKIGGPTFGSAPGQFQAPIGVAVDASGNVYVTDHDNNRVQKFSVQGTTVNYVTSWGSKGAAPGQFNGPYGITLDASGNVWVADAFNHRIQRFDANGNYLGNANGDFITPTWVSFDQAGNYYVAETSSTPNVPGSADIQNQKIKKFSASGALQMTFGSYGEFGGQFKLPFCIVVDSGGFGYVSDYYNTRIQKFNLNTPPPPPPDGGIIAAQVAADGTAATLSVTATAGASYQWSRNGVVVAPSGSASYTIPRVTAAEAGVYTCTVANTSGTAVYTGILGVTSATKVVGFATEVGTDIEHANHNIYDQILLQGPSATIRADPGQITRMSFVDLDDDIVQIEFSGAGSLSVTLDNYSPAAPPAKYNQNVAYVKGSANIVVAGANETTNVAVFSVGRKNAVNQALFRDDVTYDGMANIASLSIVSANGNFSHVLTANASYMNTRGITGVFAPGVAVRNLFVGELTAADSATPMLRVASTTDSRIAGGDCFQLNGRAIQVKGITQLKMTANENSHGVLQPVQPMRGQLEEDGVNVTARVVVPGN